MAGHSSKPSKTWWRCWCMSNQMSLGYGTCTRDACSDERTYYVCICMCMCIVTSTVYVARKWCGLHWNVFKVFLNCNVTLMQFLLPSPTPHTKKVIVNVKYKRQNCFYGLYILGVKKFKEKKIIFFFNGIKNKNFDKWCAKVLKSNRQKNYKILSKKCSKQWKC